MATIQQALSYMWKRQHCLLSYNRVHTITGSQYLLHWSALYKLEFISVAVVDLNANSGQNTCGWHIKLPIYLMYAFFVIASSNLWNLQNGEFSCCPFISVHLYTEAFFPSPCSQLSLSVHKNLEISQNSTLLFLGGKSPLFSPSYLFIFTLITSGTVWDAWQIRKCVQYRREWLWIQTHCLNDGFLKLVWQLNGCLSLRLDADMLSIIQTSSERGEMTDYTVDWVFPVSFKMTGDRTTEIFQFTWFHT